MRRLMSREVAKRAMEHRWQETQAHQTVRVSGASMGDALPDGHEVTVLYSLRPKVRRGDIVCIRRGELRVAHRLLLDLGLFCLEKGDENKYPRLCLRSSVIGVVIG